MGKDAPNKAGPRRKGAAGETYAGAGVDLTRKTEVIDRIRRLAGTTLGPQVLSGVGFFGGMYEFKGHKQPVLVSSTDSVGTKVKIAQALGKHDTIGIDIVNHCVNDIMTCGADPLFFLDYIGTGKVVSETLEDVVKGLTEACRGVGCALIGGEIAEMPSVYAGDDYDLVGFIVGVIEKDRALMGKDIVAGDAVLGLPSSGLHTNGYTLARKVLGDTREALDVYYPSLGRTLGEVLLEPHRCYYRELKPVLSQLKGIAHITGAGIIGNVTRILPAGLAVSIDTRRWIVPPIFDLIRRRGNVEMREMYRVFNMGLGMMLVCSPENTAGLKASLPGANVIGEVVPQKGRGRVVIDGKGYRSDKVL